MTASEIIGLTVPGLLLKTLFNSLGLNEYQKRKYYGLIAIAWGPSGVSKVVELLGVNPKTVYAGIQDVKNGHTPEEGRVRRRGGGRKKEIDKHPEWEETFDRIVEPHKAGLPQNKDVFWINLSVTEITRLMQAEGCAVSNYIVKQIIDKKGFSERTFAKNTTTGEVKLRNEQFMQIHLSIELCKALGLPILSIDTKKKELIGKFKRNGKTICKGQPVAYDHDYQYLADAQIVPHGIFDIVRNTGYMTIGTSHDTSLFVCENIERVWKNHLCKLYPDAETIVILCDGGGSNASSHHIVKQDLMDLANRLGMRIWVIHYPPYCSKWNPIEHRLFAYITHSWEGGILKSVEDAAKRAAKTTTSKGLKVHVDITTKTYEIKRKIGDDYKYRLKHQIVFHEKLPKWNYLVKPMPKAS